MLCCNCPICINLLKGMHGCSSQSSINDSTCLLCIHCGGWACSVTQMTSPATWCVQPVFETRPRCCWSQHRWWWLMAGVSMHCKEQAWLWFNSTRATPAATSAVSWSSSDVVNAAVSYHCWDVECQWNQQQSENVSRARVWCCMQCCQIHKDVKCNAHCDAHCGDGDLHKDVNMQLASHKDVNKNTVIIVRVWGITRMLINMKLA